MAINVSQPFHRTSANPIDESMALTKAQMKTVNDNLMPAYYFTICQDDGEIYLYNKSAIASAETGKFKKYAGGGSGDNIQVNSLPTAASSELGNIYQYIGVDDIYKNGYFYKCIEEDGVYSWKQHNTQPSDGGGGIVSPTIINKTLTAAGWNSNTKQQTVVFTGYNTNLGGVIGMPTSATVAQKTAYETAMVNVIAQNGESFTFECKNIPEIDLPVTLYAGGSSGSGGGGTADFPAGGTTGQALVKKSNADNDVEWKNISGKGHTIQDNSGTDLPQRENLKIIGASVADDSENNSTIITIDLDSKADKVQNATNNNLAGLDASGNLKDSGIAPADISGKENKFRYTTMPTASASNLGQVVQYLGTTTQVAPIYTQGYFYKCIYEDDVYKWVESKTQDNVATEMIGATTTADGKSGSVPKPFIDDRNKALFGDGHYHEIYSASQGSTVIVKADTSASSVKGQTCTLSDGRTSLTQTIDSETGEAVFTNVTLFGGVTAEATNGQGDIARGVGNITYFGQYIVPLSMNYAVVTLTTTDSALYGQNINVFKDGSQVASVAFNILGQANIALGVIGEYVFKAEANNKFAKATVNVLSLSATYSATLTLTTLFAVHYSERNSDPNSCTYPAGYSNSNFTDPFYVNLSTGKPHWGDWASDQAKFLIPKSCMLKSDGTVDYYLNEDNNKKKANGASSANGTLSYDGNAMMEWAQEGKRIYWALIPDADGQGWTWVVGDGDYDGLLKPWNHIAYDGSINHHFYTSKYASYVYNDKARSMSGYQPTNNTIIPSWITYARANNKTSAVIWDVTPFVDWLFLSLICVLFSKSLNAQAKFGRGWVDGTYITSGNAAKTSGGMDTRGLFYGNSSTASSTSGVKIFGTEQLYGDINKVMLGLINDHGTVKAKMCYGRADGSTVDDYNTTGTGYIEQGTISGTANTPVKNMNITSLALTPKVTDGSTSTYYCDESGFKTDDIFGCLYGGNSWQGDGAGIFRIGLGQYMNVANLGVGAGLSCKPLGDMR